MKICCLVCDSEWDDAESARLHREETGHNYATMATLADAAVPSQAPKSVTLAPRQVQTYAYNF